MAILCSQCGAQVPRPDVSRGAIVCVRCATQNSALANSDVEDMPTMDAPPPKDAARTAKPPPAAGRPATIPAPPPVPPARPSMIPRPVVVGGPPGQRIPAGGVARREAATPSAPPRAQTAPPPAKGPTFPPPPQSSTTPFALTKPSAKPPAPRPKPAIKSANASVAEDADSGEFTPLDSGEFEEGTGDINLATGDFESIPPRDRPPQKPPRP